MSLEKLCDKHITQTKQAIMDEKQEIGENLGKLCMYYQWSMAHTGHHTQIELHCSFVT